MTIIPVNCCTHFIFQAEANNGKWWKVHIMPRFTLHSGIYAVITLKSGGNCKSWHFLPHKMNQNELSGKQRDFQVWSNYGKMNLGCKNWFEKFQKKKKLNPTQQRMRKCLFSYQK